MNGDRPNKALMRPIGLQQKFLLALLLVGFIPGVIALAVTYWSSTTSLKQSIGSGFQEIARSAALRLATAIDAEIDQAERLALVPMLSSLVEDADVSHSGAAAAKPLSNETADRLLRRWVEKAPQYVRVVVADREGRPVALSHRPEEPQDYRQARWWQEAMRGESQAYVSSFYVLDEIDDSVFDVAVPIRLLEQDAPIGAVGLLIRRAALMQVILTIKVGETGHGMLVDTDGTPLICPILPPTSHLIPQALLNQFSPSRASSFVADDDAHGGHDTIVGAAPVQVAHSLTPNSLGGTAWYTFVRQEAAETYAPIYSLLTTIGIIGLALVVGLAGVGYVISDRFVAPIVALRRETDDLRRRFHRVAASPPGTEPDTMPALDAEPMRDEIHDLARTFHTMRAALESSLTTIQNQQVQLIRRERLASVGQLLAALAHDLRNPLGVIRSSAQLILDRERDLSVKEEVAHYIIEEVDRLTHRINDFLRYARQKPPEPVPIRPDALLEDALRQWRAIGVHHDIHVDTTLDLKLPPIHVDPSQVKEALVNLLINAREAMPNGGRLKVTSRRAASGAVELIVADTGTGISTAHLRRIFEPFFTTKEYGTGLGLTNVKRLVEDNGGTLHVTSQEGVGTTCMLYFPVTDGETERDRASKPDADTPRDPEPAPDEFTV